MSTLITEESFATFFSDLGGIVTARSHGIVSGTISNEHDHIYVDLAPYTLTEVLADLAEEEGAARAAWLKQQLGSLPQTCIVVEKGTDTHETQQLVLGLITALAQQGSLVIDMFDGQTWFSGDEVLQVHKQEQPPRMP